MMYLPVSGTVVCYKASAAQTELMIQKTVAERWHGD